MNDKLQTILALSASLIGLSAIIYQLPVEFTVELTAAAGALITSVFAIVKIFLKKGK